MTENGCGCSIDPAGFEEQASILPSWWKKAACGAAAGVLILLLVYFLSRE
ncbi:hypothetical protein [Tiger frog virus]|uniref:Uncharacterized protein n=1 Tax=Rana tigrina ranavirus TaxID=160691 RepID=A0A6M8PSY3_RTRV|nr:hypothetical protein [Tiger frog virus]